MFSETLERTESCHKWIKHGVITVVCIKHLIIMHVIYFTVGCVCVCAVGDVPSCAGDDFGVCGLHGPVWLHCTLCLRIHWRICDSTYYYHYRIDGIITFIYYYYLTNVFGNGNVFILKCSGPSMEPTIVNQDIVFSERMSRHFCKIQK